MTKEELPDRITILNDLYVAMKNIPEGCSRGRCDSTYVKILEAVLDSAESRGLTWGEFQDLDYQLMEEEKRERISRLINNGLENITIKMGNEGTIKIGSPNNYLELSSDTPSGELYMCLLGTQISNINNVKIISKFPKDKMISSKDLSTAKSYFENN